LDVQHPTGLDAYKPSEMARRVQTAGIAKARLAFLPLVVLGILAGVFIGFGALFYVLTITGAGDLSGPVRLLGGIAFSLGLILVVVGGGELFTGNTLIVMAWAGREISTSALLRNWGIVYVANFVGALLLVAAVLAADTLDLMDGEVGRTAARIAASKLALPPVTAFVRAILCNALVCLAVWLTFAARDATGKILAILWPITAFVALGFEHSVANMFLLPLGIAAGAESTLLQFVTQIAVVTLGNVVGGAGGVAITYWACYLRDGRPPRPGA
jgi:formate/nitrite transporter